MTTPSQLLESAPARPADELSAVTLQEICDMARELRQVGASGHAGKPLRDRNLALLRQERPVGVSSALCSAAIDLGARVTPVEVGDGLLTSEADLAGVVRMLGLLYDAIDCSALTPHLTLRIQRRAQIPVFVGLDGDDHWTRVVADLMALEARGLAPSAHAVLRFIGDPSERPSPSVHGIVGLMGYRLAVCTTTDPLLPPRVGFVIDARNATHWLLAAPSGTVDEPERRLCLHYVIQALLVRSVAQA